MLHPKQPATWITAAALVLLAAFLVCNAEYLADDYLMLGAAGRPSLASSLATWATEHSSVRPDDVWPKFYRPLLKLLFILDAHGFGCDARLSTLLSLALHSGCCCLVASIVNRFDPIHRRGLAAAFLSALPSAALEAPLWISARGSLIVALVILAGVRIAVSGLANKSTAWIALSGLALVAMASHESAVLAVPLWGIAIVTSIGWNRMALAALAGPLVASLAFLALRAHILGTWAGGYSGSGELASAPGIFVSAACGIEAVVVPGHGPLPLGVVGAIVMSTCVVSALVARYRTHRSNPTGAGILLGLWLMVLPLGICIGCLFRCAESLEGGRYLYLPYMGWCIAVTLSIPVGRVSGVARCSLAMVTLASAVVSVGAYMKSVETCRAILTQARASTPEKPVLLLDLPDRIEHIMCMGNALPAALEEPFFGSRHGIRGHATKSELDAGYLLGVLGVVPSVPSVERWAWNQGSLAFGAPDAPVVWRGVLERGHHGEFQVCGISIRFAVAPPLAMVGAVVEVRGTLDGGGGGRTIACTRIESVPPRLLRQVPEGSSKASWVFEGRAGEGVFLLMGDDVCCFGLGAAGAIGVGKPRYEFVGVVGETGRIAVPGALLENARLLQALSIEGPRVCLSEVRALED